MTEFPQAYLKMSFLGLSPQTVKLALTLASFLPNEGILEKTPIISY